MVVGYPAAPHTYKHTANRDETIMQSAQLAQPLRIGLPQPAALGVAQQAAVKSCMHTGVFSRTPTGYIP
jgi:hypothetical protein